MNALDYQKLCKDAGIDWATFYQFRGASIPDNSLAVQLKKFAELVIAEHQKFDDLLIACIAVDRDVEQTGTVSVGTVEQVREAIAKVST